MHVVVGSFTPSVVLAVARRTGRLDEVGLEVTENAVPSSPAQFRSMLDGETDVALTSPDNVVAYRFCPDNPLGVTADARIVGAVDRGLGLGLYARPGLGAGSLHGAKVGVDVPTSGFALAMYALTESLGAGRDDYELLALGSTPKRLRALLSGECDVTMLNAGNELLAEDAGAVRLAGVTDVCGPYLGTVISVVHDEALPAARALARALRLTARDIVAGTAADDAEHEAELVLDLPRHLARRYVDRLCSPVDGLVLEDEIDPAGLRTVVELRRRHLPAIVDGEDVLAHALEPGSGLIDDDPTST